MRRTAFAVFALFALLTAASAALACFGAMLKVAVEPDGARATAAYALGYFVAEKTGIEPEFIETADPAAALSKGEVDAALLEVKSGQVKGAVERGGGMVEGFGEAHIWLRSDVQDDIRFTTVEKALGMLPAFYSSEAYKKAASAGAEPKKSARKAVSDGT